MTPDQEALSTALAAEYAAVYAYGIIAAYAADERYTVFAEHAAAHRARRDATVDALAASGVTPPAPSAAYTAPFPVTDPVAAARLAVTVESDTAVAWRAVVEKGTTPEVRTTGVEALTEATLRLATWQGILGVEPPTTAFPGAV